MAKSWKELAEEMQKKRAKAKTQEEE